MKINWHLLAVTLLFAQHLGSRAQATVAQEAGVQPNIIVVNLDDIGPAWLPPYAERLEPADVEQVICQIYSTKHARQGTFDLSKHLDAARHSTPFMDTLSKQGAVFDWCFSTASICAPSRAGLLTGLYQQRWGGYSIPDILALGIPADVQTLVEPFSKAGYTCGMVGKWHVGIRDPAIWKKAEDQVNAAPPAGEAIRKAIVDAAAALGYESSCAPGQNPLDKGFDYYFGYNRHASRYYEADDLWENRQRVPKRPPGEFLTDLLNTKSAEFVERALDQNKKFFLYYAPMAMHGQLLPPPREYSSQFHTGIAFSDQFAGHLLAVDEGIRKLYEILKAHHQDQNTLFILSADNGQSFEGVPPYNAPFRGGKGTGWLGGSHEPLIISWPGHVAPGVRDQLVSTLDILPTALAAAGLTPPSPVDGRSLMPLLKDQAAASPHERLFSAGLQATNWSYSYFDDWQALANADGRAHNLELAHRNGSAGTDEGTSPMYLWGLTKNSLLMFVTGTRPDLYTAFPNGRPPQRLFFDLKKDLVENVNIYDLSSEDVARELIPLRNWLSLTKPPSAGHASDYEELRQTTGLKNSAAESTQRDKTPPTDAERSDLNVN